MGRIRSTHLPWLIHIPDRMSPPSILFLNRVYPPASGATGTGVARIARSFVSAGWSVTVVSTAGAGKAGVAFEDGVKVVRLSGLFSGRSLLLRALTYVVTIPQIFVRALCEPSPDIIVTMTDPPMLFAIGPLLRVIKGSRIIHWAQDLYPDVAVRAGVLSEKGVLARIFAFLSRRALMAHDRVVVVGRCMGRLVSARGVAPGSLSLIPNTWSGLGITSLDREESLLPDLGLLDRFTVMYSGNFGRVHEFGTILSAAKLLQESGRHEVVFLLSGDGPNSALLRGEVARMGLSNVRFLPRCDDDQLSRTLASGDLHLVTMLTGMGGVVVPSKYYGVMAAGRPCIFVGPKDTEIALALHDLGNGLCVAPGDSQALVEAILKIRGEAGWSDRARDLAEGFLASECSGREFVRLATELISGTPC